MTGSEDTGFNLGNICLFSGTNGMDQLIITGAFGKVGIPSDQYLSTVIFIIGV